MTDVTLDRFVHSDDPLIRCVSSCTWVVPLPPDHNLDSVLGCVHALDVADQASNHGSPGKEHF